MQQFSRFFTISQTSNAFCRGGLGAVWRIFTVMPKKTSRKEEGDKADGIFLRIGTFGKWQALLCICFSVEPGFFDAFKRVGSSFIAPDVQHWCARPPSSNISLETWLENHIPKDTSGKVSKCESILANKSVSCNAWEYNSTIYPSTATEDFNLVCGREYLRDMLGATYMAGVLIGAVVGGHMADFIGRQKTILLAAILDVVSGVAGSFSGSIEALMFWRFLSACSANTARFTFLMEIVGSRWRTSVGIFTAIPWAFGVMALPVAAYYLKYWPHLLLLSHIPGIVSILIYTKLPESPRWLISHGRLQDAEKVLNKAAKFNKQTIPPDLPLLLSAPPAKKLFTIIDLLKTPRLRNITFNMWLNWFTLSFVYYGIMLSGSTLVSDAYLNMFLSGLVELPSNVFTYMILSRAGRRRCLVWFHFVGATCLLSTSLIPKDTYPEDWPILVLVMLGKFCINSNYTMIYIYSSELFPTVARNIGIGSCSMVARIGGISGSLMQFLGRATHQAVPVILFGAAGIITGVVSFLLPETKGEKLPDTLGDAEQQRRRRKGRNATNPLPVRECSEVSVCLPDLTTGT